MHEVTPSDAREGVALALTMALSIGAAFGISAVQAANLGDRPGAMLLAGLLLGAVPSALRLAHPLGLGVLGMAGFPAWCFTDLAWNGGHNLLPFELLFYAVYALLGVGVAFLARGLGAVLRRAAVASDDPGA